MSIVIRPRFGRPCFECGDTVLKQRVDHLHERAAKAVRILLKSDLLCVSCEREREAKGIGHVERRPRF